MDILHLATSPADPSWEAPRFKYHRKISSSADYQPDVGENVPPHTLSERATLLYRAAGHLTELCGQHAQLDKLQDFFATWQDPYTSNRIQPNALAWFSDTNALGLMCLYDRLDVLELLLEQGLQPTPLVIAVAIKAFQQNENTKLLSMILRYGWDINKPLSDGTPPVMDYLIKGLTYHKWSVAFGTDPNTTCKEGYNLMTKAATSAPLEISELLVELGGRIQGTNLVAHAAYECHLYPERLQIIQFLLDHGASIDAELVPRPWNEGCQTSMGLMIGTMNGLHFASWRGRRDIVELLIQRGASLEKKAWSGMWSDGKNSTPAEIAKRGGHEDIAILLENVTRLRGLNSPSSE